MTTSLAQQLKKLALPETSVYKHEKKKTSLLFDPKEAASIDRETFFEIGLSGLSELKKINPSFVDFENTLFDPSSKDFERAVQTKDSNDRLNKIIKSFLLRLSPYFLIQPAHKALEWLIHRYQIHKYNKDHIFSLILPYHETKIFIRFLQILKISDDSDSWNWLAPLQKPGIPLAKTVLYNHCISNVYLLKFITSTLKSAVKEFGEKAEILTTLFAFYCSTIVGTLENATKVTEPLLVNILPGLMECMSSPLIDLRAAGYIITAQIVTKTQINEKVAEHLVNKLFLLDIDLHYEAVLLLNMIFETQERMDTVSRKSLSNMTPGHIKIFCSNLGILINSKIDITKLLLAFMKGVLPLIQQDTEYFRIFSTLPTILLSEVNISSYTAEKLIICVVECYEEKATLLDDSDIVMVIDGDTGDDNTGLTDIQAWYSKFMKSIEQKYPNEFDRIIKDILKSSTESGDKNLSTLNTILGFAPKIMKKLGDSFLFEKLYHHNPAIRAEAVKYLIADYKALKNADQKFLAESIVDRLGDENPNVVSTTMRLDMNKIIDLVPMDVFIDNLRAIIKKGQLYPEWWSPACSALRILCSLDDPDYNTYICILPYLFPTNEETMNVTFQIIKSPLGKLLISDNKMFSNLLKSKTSVEVCNIAFDILKYNKSILKRNNILNVCNYIENDDYMSVFFSLIMLSFNANEVMSSTDHKKIIQNVSEFVKNLNTAFMNNVDTISGDNITSLIEFTKGKKIPIETLIFYYKELIVNSELYEKDWIDFNNQDFKTNFLIQMFEISLDKKYSVYKKFRTSILKELFNLSFKTTLKKIEFIANMVIGYQTTTKKYDSEIFAILSTKILHALIEACDINVLDSDILITSILINLNSSKTVLRKMTIDISKSIVKKAKLSDHHQYIFLQELISREEEITLDNNQLPLVLYMLLSPDPSIRKVLDKKLQAPMKLSMKTLTNIVINDVTPYHIKAALNNILTDVNSSDITASLSTIALSIINNLNEVDLYQSQIISNVILRLEPSPKYIENATIWEFLKTTLTKSDTVLIGDMDNIQYVSVLMMQKIDNEFFKVIPTNKIQDVLYMILEAGTFGKNSQITSAASKMIKKIDLDAKHFLNILKAMNNICEQNKKNNTKKKKSSAVEFMALDTKEWKLGVTLLEYIQNKRKLSGFNDMLPVLFDILKKCLDFEEQSVVEYVKQLLLTTILNSCQKICPMIEDGPKPKFKGVVDIELIVLCIRGTQNPQTHHHALMLLAHVAYMFPDQVLQYMMAIFTFIGSSVLRQDDAYSFQIITKIIETVIPILVKSKSNQNLESSVIPILRIFVDAVLDIPEHRRLPVLKKLLITLDASNFLWTFLSLIFESHVVHGINEKSIEHKHRLSEKQERVTRLDFAMALVLEFPSEIIIESCNKLMMFIKTLPDEKPENENTSKRNDPSLIFSVENHSAKQLRHFKYTLITFVNNVLSSQMFIQNQDPNLMEEHYKTFIIHILTFVQRVSRNADQNQGNKYWKVMLHHCYEVLDNVNNRLSSEMFMSVIRGLMSHDLSTVKRKAMEVLNTKLQYNNTFFNTCDKNLVFNLLDPILNEIENIGQDNTGNKQEQELNQQTALLSLKLLVRFLCPANPDKFKPILSLIADLTKSSISGNLMASVVLCLAELCSNLKAHAIGSLPKFMPALIKILKNQTTSDTPEIILLSVITAIYKIMETIPLFLSPYLEKLLFNFSILSAKWSNVDSKISSITSKLTMIMNKISSTIPPRVLIPIINQSYNQLLKKGHFDAIGPVMTVLADSFSGVSGPEFMSLQQDLTNFFLLALQLRSDYIDNDYISEEQINDIEGHIVTALAALVLKLSESSFRPLYFKIYDWSNRESKERSITFYRLSSHIANKLRGLFILFAGHFIKNATDLLNACNSAKTDTLYYESEEKCCVLITHILNTLLAVFTFDSHNFVNKDRFESIMQPLVDQLDNEVGGIDALSKRAREIVIPCVSQFAIATADDSLWKPLNYQILLKTRHNDSVIRLIGLECIREMAVKLGDSWLPLLPESVPFLAELLEDDVPSVEAATQKAIQALETILGEPLQKYF